MINPLSSGAATSRINAGGAMMASNFETFLTLLTAQLKNQDPLSPVDSNQFTAQLTQMAGVEQQLLTNELLTALLDSNRSGGLASASNYLGRDATAAWSTVKLEGGQATWSYELGANANSARLDVIDGGGRVVWSGNASQLTAGVHDFTWDGTSSSGQTLPDGGIYSLKITANGPGSTGVASQVLIRGRVTGVEIYDGQPYLTIGNSILPLNSVIALEERTQTGSGTA